MRYLNGAAKDPMSPQVMLRRHASSAAAVFQRPKEREPVLDRAHHTVKKRPAPARPPLPARLRSHSAQPLPARPENDCTAQQVFVNAATSRICLANSLDGLFDPPAAVIVVQALHAPVRGLQSIRSVTEDKGDEIQAVSCWLGGLCKMSPTCDFLVASGCLGRTGVFTLV